MNLLLKGDGYPPAVLLALLLHGALLWVILDKTLSPSEFVKIEPAYVSATTAKENPQKLRKLEELKKQQTAQRQVANEAKAREQAVRDREAAQKAEAERKKKAEDQRVADQRKKDETLKKEQEQQAAARRKADEDAAAERQRQAEAQKQREAQQKAETDRQSLANSQSSSADNDLVSQYLGLIQDLITQNWDIPPSARNSMRAVLELRTSPVGDILSSVVIVPSGDTAFDRSVLQAVARVGNLQELRDLPNAIYEQNFRTFRLEFKPEDLLR